jgi:hypothetical protein
VRLGSRPRHIEVILAAFAATMAVNADRLSHPRVFAALARRSLIGAS